MSSMFFLENQNSAQISTSYIISLVVNMVDITDGSVVRLYFFPSSTPLGTFSNLIILLSRVHSRSKSSPRVHDQKPLPINQTSAASSHLASQITALILHKVNLQRTGSLIFVRD